MSTIKNRTGKDFIEAEEIENKWKEYTEKLVQKKSVMTHITTMVWSLTPGQTFWSVKASGP